MPLPSLRFVDDFFTADRSECVAHAKRIFSRLVKCLLGPTAIAEHKLMHANPLPVLGIQDGINSAGVAFQPEAENVEKWIDSIKLAFKSKQLSGGEASSLAGKLSWASQHIFRKLGRAMLCPIFAQIRRSSSEVGEELAKVLSWWLGVLQQGSCEIRCWRVTHMKPVQLLCDARSTPPRVAAVLLIDGCCEYADMEPQTHTMEQFKRRGDNQIASLELLAIAFGLSTFEEKSRGRNIVVHSDNTTAENGVRKG